MNKIIKKRKIGILGKGNNLEGMLRSVAGMKSVEADYDNGHILVEYDLMKTNYKRITKEIAGAGYSVIGKYKAKLINWLEYNEYTNVTNPIRKCGSCTSCGLGGGKR